MLAPKRCKHGTSLEPVVLLNTEKPLLDFSRPLFRPGFAF
jgi:hypothetical protein